MSSTNEKLRNGIREVANECQNRRLHSGGAVLCAHLTAIEDCLRKILSEDGLDASPTDTARLDWLCDHANCAREDRDQRKDLYLVAGFDVLRFQDGTGIERYRHPLRAAIDAAMRPAPKYRPWTPKEAIGKAVCMRSCSDAFMLITTTTKTMAILNGCNAVELALLCRNYVQPDGSPCGVEVKE